MMSFDDYQKESRKTAMYPNIGNNIVYTVLGIGGEAGEIQEKVKKVLRDKDGFFDETSKKQIALELGDLLWYMAQTCTEAGLSMQTVANMNLEKLAGRMARGTIHGSGDNR